MTHRIWQKKGRLAGETGGTMETVKSGFREWFRRLAAGYLAGAPAVALLLIPWAPHQVIGVMFILHGLLLAPTFIPNAAVFAPVIRRFKTGEKVVFLTLDDGPDPETTPAVLKLLEAYGAKACFFVVGAKARAHPGLLRAIRDAGHELGNHTDSHRERWFWSALWEDVDREIDACSRAIREAAEVSPRWFRPPVGMTNPFVYPVLRKRGLCPLGWSAWARDAGRGGSDEAAARVMKSVAPGAVIVMHPERTGLECIEKVLSSLHSQGYRCIPLPTTHGDESLFPESAQCD